MSNEYGQQPYPANQSPVPGFGPPQYPAQYPAQQQYGYPQTPPGGQPMYQQPAYAAGPGGYGMGYGQPLYARPGSATGAAVLGFIQAGLTLITTGLVFFGLFGSASAQGSGAAIAWGLAIAQLLGLLLLIFGSVQLLSGTSRVLYLVGAVVELAISAYYLVSILAIDTSDAILPEFAQDLKTAFAVVPVIFAIMPLIGLILALGSATSDYVRSNRG
ncbi:hypothetical protein DMH04_28220 [Kibdelosporangium aridum]|uniref:Uncharacterized protein n=1 Tax=Kibdelosporangium aridum TaxID=2030 RepID=A0A428Z4B9_KIBAR|nr:hypothetical protein [Kibdelosporangium aridum]RSM81281.1 hypothetical protein DMH04_28220 [Kibdelosporangium aridum]